MSDAGAQAGQLFGRKWNVTVANAGQAEDLSQLHIKFKVNVQDVETPNNCDVRIYNLSDATANRLVGNEFNRVVISAGYESGPYGIIFDGTIKQSRRGRENQIDTYVDILGADGDGAYNYALVAQTIAAGQSTVDVVKALSKDANVGIAYLPESFGDPNLSIRGKVMFGLYKDHMRNIAQSNNARWSLQNGKLVLISNSGYIVAEAISLNSKNGMIGIPQQTQSGIMVKSLLNPNLVIGQPVKINNADIQNAPFSVEYAALNLFPSKSADGLYRIVVAEHYGDTRGNDWETDLTCFAINANKVNPWPGHN